MAENCESSKHNSNLSQNIATSFSNFDTKEATFLLGEEDKSEELNAFVWQ